MDAMTLYAFTGCSKFALNSQCLIDMSWECSWFLMMFCSGIPTSGVFILKSHELLNDFWRQRIRANLDD